MPVKFNQMSVVGNEEKYLLEALHSGKWSGRGPKTLALEKLVREKCQVKHAFFVTSCTSAMEISTLVAGVGPGDEVIIPSFAFVSSANAVALRGARPVFADIDLETWNLSRATVEPLITPKTKVVMPVHYGGSTAGVEELRKLCQERGIFLAEDAAQSLGALRGGKPIGGTPWTACFSLHDTKNISSGEGGLIVTDSDEIAARIEIVIEKGTNRQRFLRGQVDKYTWVDIGSSFIASDLLAAVGLGQLEQLEKVTSHRQKIYRAYQEGLKKFEGSEKIHWQKLSAGIVTTGHAAAFRCDPRVRHEVLSALKAAGVEALFHYVPLHDAPFAQSRGYSPKKDLPNTRLVSEGLVRLPIWYGMTNGDIEFVVEKTGEVLGKIL